MYKERAVDSTLVLTVTKYLAVLYILRIISLYLARCFCLIDWIIQKIVIVSATWYFLSEEHTTFATNYVGIDLFLCKIFVPSQPQLHRAGTSDHG